MTDSQLVEILENMLLTPSSDFYISTILYNPDGSALDPRDIDYADLGIFDVQGISIGIIIRCLNIRGLSNSQVKFDAHGDPEITVDSNKVTFHAKQPNTQPGYQRPQQVPNQILASGELDITLAGQSMPPGSISVTINSVDDLTGVFSATLDNPGRLDTVTITFFALSVNPRIGDGNIKIQVSLDTVFQDAINQILNRDENQKRIIDEINSKLSSPDILTSLSQVATEKARAALSGISPGVDPLTKS